MVLILEQEGIVLLEEGISGSVTFRKFRAPWKRYGYRRNWFVGSVVLTEIRFAAFGFSRPVINVPLEREQIESGDAFEPRWLSDHGLAPRAFSKHAAADWRAALYNLLTPTTPSWNGHNASGWKSDLLRVNGFDERMQYGGQDRELGERLQNAGVRGKQIRYLAICLHLDHGRGYATQESVTKNRGIRDKTRRERRTWTRCGIEKGELFGPLAE